MASHTPAACAEAELFRHQARTIHQVIHLQTDGVTHNESLIQPKPAGNCLNWVVGHLIAVYNNALPMLEQETVTSKEALAPYQRGALPLEDHAQALQIAELLALWDAVNIRVDAGLAALPAERLDQPAPFSPTGNPNETVRTLLSTVMFHQAYHTGQTALLRRIVGKPGAIR
jgi:uncharacterized damage-inducible protein DinB